MRVSYVQVDCILASIAFSWGSPSGGEVGFIKTRLRDPASRKVGLFSNAELSQGLGGLMVV